MAGSPMVFVESETIQDTTPVFRGSMNQLAIGLVIQTSGKGNPLNITSIECKPQISTGNLADNVENVRLWTTGNKNEFECYSQVGNTLPVIQNEKFAMAVNKELASGRNYFWLTFDMRPGANSPAYLDMACTDINIGAINYQPKLSSPVGSRLISGNVPYYSMGGLLINHADSWNTKRD